MDGISVNRWRRYGKDRLYVEGPDGLKIGYWDLLDDTAHPTDPADAALASTLVTAVDAWRTEHLVPAVVASAGQSDSQPEPEPQPEPPVAAPTIDRPWVDLATNRPGAQARERADAAFVAAPVRTTLARMLGVHTDERAWRIGADGEEKVAAQLARLARKDPRWRSLHAVPVGSRGSDIDHVVVGPGGVFTINAKHHPGATVWVGGDTVMIDGARVPYVRNARHEARRAARLLSEATGLEVPVVGVIAVARAGDVVVKAQPADVTLLPRMQLGRWLARHGDVLAPEACEAVFEAARRSTTWR